MIVVKMQIFFNMAFVADKTEGYDLWKIRMQVGGIFMRVNLH